MPFKAKIQIKYKSEWLEKLQTSSMFPKNWKIERIQEEVAWVYENTVTKGIGQLEKKPNDLFDKFIGESSNGFDILIEIDNSGNIINAYPYLK